MLIRCIGIIRKIHPDNRADSAAAFFKTTAPCAVDVGPAVGYRIAVGTIIDDI